MTAAHLTCSVCYTKNLSFCWVTCFSSTATANSTKCEMGETDVLFVRLSLSVGTWPLTLSGHSASGWPSPSSALTGSRWASCCARPSDRAAWSPTFRKKKVWRLLGQGGVCGGQLLGVEDRFELQDPGHHVGGGQGAGGHQDRGTREREGRLCWNS